MNNVFNWTSLFSSPSSDVNPAPHNSDQILGESSSKKLNIHNPEDLTNSFVSMMESMPMGKELINRFISVAGEKGKVDLCEEINQPKKVYFEDWTFLIYGSVFIVNGLIVYRGISQIVSDLPISADPKIVGFILAGILGTCTEVSLGKIIFSKVNIHRFFRLKQLSLYRERRNDGKLAPIRKARINGKIRFLNEILHGVREKNVRGTILTWFDLVLLFCCLVGLGIDAVGAIKTIEELLRGMFANGKTPVEILWLQYLTAALPVVIVILISMILGNLLYYPQDLNYVLREFTKRAKDFDLDELQYHIACNNELCTEILSDPSISKEEVDIIKLEHEIQYLRDCLDKHEVTFLKEMSRIDHTSDDEDSETGIDKDTKNELLKQTLQRAFEIKKKEIDRKIKIKEEALADLRAKNSSTQNASTRRNGFGNNPYSSNGNNTQTTKNGQNNGKNSNGKNG